MQSRKFLEQVADHYLNPLHHGRLEDYVFVFPNKRSGRFLKRYMQQRMTDVSFMPRFVTIGALVARLSGLPEAPRRDCLFELYDAYRETLNSKGGENTPREFDKFIFWGEIILSDFDEIDRNGVNARELYTNLSRLREISADYLDDEQKTVVREIWGESAVPESVHSFWRHVGGCDDGNGQNMASRFVSLWEILADIYESFVGKLRAKSMATVGMQHREALNRVRRSSRDDFADTTYVFVGFNAPTVAETLIFEKLKSLGAAEFFWDTASPFITGEAGDLARNNQAFAMLGRLAARFPMPGDFSLDKVEGIPAIDVVGMPSRTAQCKMAHSILERWMADGDVDVNDAIETAVIIPDESLLMPMLHSLPLGLRSVNITMGMPFATTAFAAMLRSVVSMQMRARRIRGTWRFFYEDVLELLAHPHIRSAAADESDSLRRHIVSNNLYTIEAGTLHEKAPRLDFLFRAVDDARNIDGVHGYLCGLIDGIHGLLSSKTGAGWELRILEYLRAEIDDLARLLKLHGVEAGEKSYFTLFERALRSITITMEGTPLKGLQVMSVPETRGLDFDNILMLSMNERVFPGRSSVKTMIPNNLRAGYGLPPTDRAESEASYYFYRLIGRARNVALLYDSRDASSGTGEASRFITQLRYLHSSGDVTFRSVSVGANAPEKRDISVHKTEEVLRRLDRYLAGGDSFLSASALKTFKHCGLKFYLQYVRGLRGEDEITEYMTSAVYGTILHAAAQHIYDDYKGRPVTAPVLAGLAANVADRYTPAVEALIQREYYHREAAPGAELPVEGRIVCDLILDFLSSMFRHEQNAWCRTASDAFYYREGEKLVKGVWNILPDKGINFKMYIDRVDETASGLRFIDYKTGGDETEARDIQNLFNADDSRHDALLQILAYCEAYAAMERDNRPIQPVLYTFRTMDARGGISPIRIGGEDIVDYHQISSEFLPPLQELIGRIFDSSLPFVQAEEGSATCGYCVFAPMCGRVSRNDI